MDSLIARERLAEVVRPDSITYSQGDFLATHVAMNSLQLLNKFEPTPNKGNTFSENEIFEKYILNKENEHRFIAVYGESGTGKSHLIRWFNAMMEQNKPDNEVVLFIKRSDNTLKGTIKQLLELPEVQKITNGEIYRRLLNASAVIDDEKFKDTLYHNFIVEVKNDKNTPKDDKLYMRIQDRKNLEGFLCNDVVQEFLLSEDGPIERIYSKISDNNGINQDVIARFEADDFTIDAELSQEIRKSHPDSRTERMIPKLSAENENNVSEFVANYMNKFIDSVIQSCSGIKSGDFRQIFQDIRKELFMLGKNLTLFIEDITSFTGVDKALLDALIVEHTGMNSKEHFCRLTSVVGTTSNYLQFSFLDNHKDRVTKFVYIPDNAFSEKAVFEFIGKYLNTMSLQKNRINEWMEAHADMSEYPIHDVKEGKNWDSAQLDNGKKLCLYPFTKNSIRYFYKNSLEEKHRTPRHIIRNIIEPIVNEILFDKNSFPSDKFRVLNYDQTLTRKIADQVPDKEQANRLLRFACIWGTGQAYSTTNEKTGVHYICGITEDIFNELELPIIKLENIKEEPDRTDDEIIPVTPPPITPQTKPDTQKQEILAQVVGVLTDWVDGKEINAGSSSGISGILKDALKDLNDYLADAINWQAEGISFDDAQRIIQSNKKLIVFENQTKAKYGGFYTMKANIESRFVIEAFIRQKLFVLKDSKTKKIVYYDGYDFDVFTITSWFAKYKEAIIKSIKGKDTKKATYVEAALSIDILRKIFNGYYTGISLSGFTVENLFKDSTEKISGEGHSNEWNIVKKAFDSSWNQIAGDSRYTLESTKVAQQFSNLVMGNKTSAVIVLDYPMAKTTLSKVKKQNLFYQDEQFSDNEEVASKRGIIENYIQMRNRISKAVLGECEKSKHIIERIETYFEIDKESFEDDFDDLISGVVNYNKELSQSIINVQPIPVDPIKKQKGKIKKSLDRVIDIENDEDILKKALMFSTDPLYDLQKFADWLEIVNKTVENVDKKIADKIALIHRGEDSTDENSSYKDERAGIAEFQKVIEELGCVKC